MNEAMLIIMLMVNNIPIHHVKHISKYNHFNYQACLETRDKLRSTWSKVLNAEIVYIGCYDPWSET